MKKFIFVLAFLTACNILFAAVEKFNKNKGIVVDKQESFDEMTVIMDRHCASVDSRQPQLIKKLISVKVK